MDIKELLKGLNEDVLFKIKYMIEDIIGHYDKRHSANVIKNAIIRVACNNTRLSLQELRKKSRKREHVEARQIMCYLLRCRTKMTTTSIGLIFNYDHSTVIHCCKQVPDLVLYDEDFKRKFQRIEKQLKEELTRIKYEPDQDSGVLQKVS